VWGRSWVKSNTQGLKITEKKALPLYFHQQMVRLEFQVFSDKDHKPENPSHNPCSQINVGRSRTHTLFLKSTTRSRCCVLVSLGSDVSKRLVVYEATFAKTATSQRNFAEC